MSKIEKIKKLSLLFDLYKELLTDTQKELFINYYLEDLSLAEIAEMNNSSRASVSDGLKKTEEKLLKYESKIQLSKRNKKIEKLLDKLTDEQTISKIKEIL